MTTLQSATATLFGRTQARHTTPGWLARAIGTVQCWAQRVRSRDALAELDEQMLKDVGLTRADIVVESSKHFWQR
jgi:uncharacterized protein YjiS (DUF1127 family)